MAAAAASTEPPSTRTAHVRFSVAARAREKGSQRRRTGSAFESACWGIEHATRASGHSASEQLAHQSFILPANKSKYARRVRLRDPFRFLTLSGRASIPTSPESARTQ